MFRTNSDPYDSIVHSHLVFVFASSEVLKS